ncbi:hypothetical protein F8M41_013107 [Gigaspora margarita]|uniref:Uncharacterized protein n=1 Tax=Gigaspora margarita TaxID=4874 RepID=A0A8H3WX31_GIGMA|nr:hypothetical protein F8M41_013107 [Gigaspora margarita]
MAYVELLKEIIFDENFTDQEDCQIKSNVLDEHIIESDLLLKRKLQNSGEEVSTPLNKVRIFDTGYDSDLGLYNGESSSSDPETVPKLLTNVFLEVKDSGVDDDDNILEFVDNYDDNVDIDEQTPIPEPVDNNKENDSVPKRKVTRNKPKYIQHDLAQELLTNLRLCPLKGHKWLWEDIDIINLFKDNKNTKTYEVKKTLFEALCSNNTLTSLYMKNFELNAIEVKMMTRMDSRATIMSISQEVLIQDNGRYDNASKRKNDLTKLEYCSKVLLTSVYLALPTVSRPDIHSILCFENTICMLGLTDIIIPRTVDAFPKCVEAVCKVLSWKARSRNKTKIFHELIGKSTSQLHERKYFTPKKLAYC